ncbi:TIGR00255 family protein [Lachnospiraceae bacterium]|nr:TIGR00255 family protein [Lachnospiraceae bacterium]
MVYSMTGFGRSEYSDENRRIIIEIKSVNHRYCDVSIKLPRIISRFEPELRKRIKLYAERGKIDIFVTYNNLKSSGYMVKYDKEVLQQYMDHFKTIEKDFGLEEEYKPTVVARFPDVLTVEEDYYVEDEEYEIIEKVFDEAGKQFMESRKNEGTRLSADIIDKMAELEKLTCQVDELAPKMIEEFRTKLTEKVEKLLEATDIDDSRIVQEVTIYSDKVAVDEELVRLHSHIAAVREMLSENDEAADSDGEGGKAQEKNSSIGRRLDFIVQEMNREANTTLSKSDTLAVTDIGIDMKTCIEKVREQVQNIE